MKTTGIIVEYNPLHNGHMLHLEKSKSLTNCDVLIGVMSGNYMQRGEPALISKWHRAEMAVHAGVDLIIELPFFFATQSADYFANQGVAILTELGATSLVFGSEGGQIESIRDVAQVLINEKEKPTHSHILGQSFPKNMATYAQLKDQESFKLNAPNNILGIQYVRAIIEQNSQLKPLAITRTGSGYHDPHPTHQEICSATSIRNTIFKEKEWCNHVTPFLPESTIHILESFTREGGKLVGWENLFPYLQMKIATMSPKEIQEILLVSEGIENRIKRLVPQSEGFIHCMEALKSKRYTWTRLMRTLLHIATNTKRELSNEFHSTSVPYIRILGFNEKGQAFLNAKKKQCRVPMISLPKQIDHPLLHLEEQVDTLYALMQDEPYRKVLMERSAKGPYRKI